MKNHFLISYFGNKRQEVKIIYEELKFNDDNINTYYIVEPFCGSSAMSYYIWLNNRDKTNFKYILNDNNKFIIDLYNIAKDENNLKNSGKN